MMESSTAVGRCPTCVVAIPREDLLFETTFEAGDEPIGYAECPSCQEVVHPFPWGDP